MKDSLKIIIGIHYYSNPDSLFQTIGFLHAHTNYNFDLIILTEPSQETNNSLRLSEINYPLVCFDKPVGAPKCFNGLISYGCYDIYVFLENGALVGPGWLDYIIFALNSDKSFGLAGPSTNSVWNEQYLRRLPRINTNQIEDISYKIANQYGNQIRSLEPLYSLADFCYVVKREVVESIGAADESYALGPCWEMDYNLRAERAGYKGGWVCSSFVFRSIITIRRRIKEIEFFERNKKIYQNKFCAMKINRQREGYKEHCMGDSCVNFAPINLINTWMPIKESQSKVISSKTKPPFNKQPLVSCIMPTKGRPEFVKQSIKYFLDQDYHNKELIIVYDNDLDLPALNYSANIKKVEAGPGSSIGNKRNLAIKNSNGSIIAHWDDDDIYAFNRLSMQIEPIISGTADITGLTETLLFDLNNWQCWRTSSRLYKKLFVQNIHGGTLAYRSDLWNSSTKFPNTSLREDVEFLMASILKGARLKRINGRNLFIYLRHNGNSWSFVPGQKIDPNGWEKIDFPELLIKNKIFYANITGKGSYAKESPSIIDRSTPMVSCIMPTYNRSSFVEQSIKYFLRQDYPRKELVIIDDAENTVEDMVPSLATIVYHKINGRRTIGVKRNLACKFSAGEIIIHWDDDDWYSPKWISSQVYSLMKNKADVTGLNNVNFFSPLLNKAWKYSYMNRSRPWVAGGSLCYLKEFWKNNMFEDIDIGEDSRFVWSNTPKNLVSHDFINGYVAVIHRNNTSPKRTNSMNWKEINVKLVEELLDRDKMFYKEIS